MDTSKRNVNCLARLGAAGAPRLLVTLLTIGASIGFAQIPQSDLSTEQLAAATRGEVAAARTQLAQAKQDARAHRDKEAANILHTLVQAHPSMLDAANDLAFLQATSQDTSVRNPAEAVLNAERVIDLAEKRLIQRRKIRGEQNVVNPFNNIPLPATFYQVTMLNTLAVAYAAAGKFTSDATTLTAAKARMSAGNGGCAAPAARDLSTMALEAAQHAVQKNPTPENKQLLTFVQQTHASIQANKAVTGVLQP
jgi:hypothetical protein